MSNSSITGFADGRSIAAELPQMQTLPTARVSAWDIGAGIIPAVVVAPLILGQLVRLWIIPQTRLGILVWLIVAGIVAWRARGSVTRHLARMTFALTLLVIATGLLVAAVLYWSYNLGHAAAAFYLMAWALGRCSERSWHEILSWGGLFLMTLPIPIIYQSLDSFITSLSGLFASIILDAHRVMHLLDDGTLTLKSASFKIAKVDSVSLGVYAVIIVTGLWTWLWARSLLHSVLLALSACVGLLLVRTMTIVTVAAGLQFWQQNWLTGRDHYLLSLATFGVVMLLVISLDRFVLALTTPVVATASPYMLMYNIANTILVWPHPRPIAEDYYEVTEIREYYSKRKKWRQSWYRLDWHAKLPSKITVITCATIAIFAALPIFLVGIRGRWIERAEGPTLVQLEPVLKQFKRELLPLEIGVFRLADHQVKSLKHRGDESNPLGVVAALWAYQWEDLTFVVELTAPVTQWREPLTAERSASMRTEVSVQTTDDPDAWDWCECHQVNRLGGESYVLQCCLQDDLSPAQSPASKRSRSWPIAQRLQTGGRSAGEVLYDIRIYCESGRPLTDSQFMEMNKLFQQTRQLLRQRLPANLLIPLIASPR